MRAQLLKPRTGETRGFLGGEPPASGRLGTASAPMAASCTFLATAYLKSVFFCTGASFLALAAALAAAPASFWPFAVDFCFSLQGIG